MSASRSVALMGSFGVVGREVGVEVGLHLVDGLVELGPTHDAEVLVEERAVQALDVAVGLRTADLGRAAFDFLQLQEQFEGMMVWSTAIFPTVVRKHGVDAGFVGLEGQDDIVVHDVHGGRRELGRVRPAPGITQETIDDSLQIDLADALEIANEEGVDGDQVAGCVGSRCGVRGTRG